MKDRFSDAVKDMRGLINEWSAPVLLAVSGGMDSMCMADLFASCLPAAEIAVAHCNFNLRGDESDGDESLVREWAGSKGIRLHVKSFDTEGFASQRGISIEMAARELRYSWFAALCVEHGYAAVSVAHNANDNAETLILNLLRGTGVEGLVGMTPVSELPCPGTCRRYLMRPLLQFTRKQIEGYVIANRVPYRNDSTNFSSDYKRNRIRNEVFPVFEKLNPSAVRTINRNMGYFAEASSIVSDYCDREVSSGLCTDGEAMHQSGSRSGLSISCSELLSRRHWRYLLYHMLEPYGFNSSTLASVEDLLVSDRTFSGKRFESRDYMLLTERNELRVVRKVSDLAGDVTMAVRTAGTYHFNGMTLKVESLPWTSDMPLKQPEGVLVFDKGMLKFPFVFRKWRQGDWLVPLGMKGKKKVSDLFADLKYDAFRKDTAVIVADVQSEGLAETQHIAAVAGVRMDDRYKVTSSTTGIIRLTIVC